MKRLFAGGTCLAGVLAFGIVALAQAPPTQPPATQPPATQPPAEPPAQTPPPAAQQDTKAPAQQVTILGCVQKEADYRRAKNLGKGGAAGTGAGAGNEFVLINASTAPAGAAEPAPTGTAGGPPAGNDEFEVTGANEAQLETFVGKRVEIVAKLKAAETKATGTTGGATAEMPGSRDLKLREVEVMSVKEAAGTCPAVPR